MTTIIVKHEDNEIDEFAFDAHDRVISIGRRSTNDVCIPNLSVSGMHARITIDGDSASIEDNNSTNGSYVNGRLISRQLLNPNDEIVIGKTRVVVRLSSNDITAESSRSNTPAVNAEPPVLSAVSDYDDVIDPDDSFVGDTRRASEHDQFDERPLSLSEKAKLALGRQNGRDSAGPRTTLNGVAKGGIAAVSATGVTAASNRAFAHDDDVAIAEAPQVAENPSILEPVEHEADTIDPHPLDGLDGELHSPALQSATDKTGNNVSASATVRKPAGAVIEIQNGAKSGQVLPIDKPVTTLGRPGIQIAAIMRKPDGYFLMHIESDDSVDMPTLNHDTIGDDPVMLHSGDRVNVAGIDVEFMLS